MIQQCWEVSKKDIQSHIEILYVSFAGNYTIVYLRELNMIANMLCTEWQTNKIMKFIILKKLRSLSKRHTK